MSRQYTSAGSIVKSILFEGSTLKKVWGNRSVVGKVDYALACETLKYAKVIKTILEKANISMESLNISHQGVFYVMLYELLFGKGKIDGGGAVKRKLNEYIDDFRRILTTMMNTKGVTLPQELLSSSIQYHSSIPKYIRINQLKTSIMDGIQAIKDTFPVVDVSPDIHIPSIVPLPNTITNLGNHPLIKSGQMIIQDKASCFPSQILMDEWNEGDIIDCCAAPGNKTSHMASIAFIRQNNQHPDYYYNDKMDTSGTINNSSNSSNNNTTINTITTKTKIFAFDKSPHRVKLLQRRMNEAGANQVFVKEADFLSIDSMNKLYENVTAVLVDPSCSGSGVVRSLDRVIEEFEEDDSSHNHNRQDIVSNTIRLKQLQEFQVSIVLKAMSYPHVKTVVYSTCSIHEEENEWVVSRILSSEGISKKWKLKAPERMKDWYRRGNISFTKLTHEQLKCLIRCHPSDGMNGFFVALFTKLEESVNSVVSTKQTIRIDENSNRNRISDENKQSKKRRMDNHRELDDFNYDSSSKRRPSLWRLLSCSKYF